MKAIEAIAELDLSVLKEARQDMAKTIFFEMYCLVRRAERNGDVITVSSDDIEAIARRYGVEF